jgi:hypothetical protein
MRKVTINPVLNGFIVEVGCSKVVFNDIDTLCGELIRYQSDPRKVEKEYLEFATNKLCTERQTPEPASETLNSGGVVRGNPVESYNYKEDSNTGRRNR